MSKQSILPDLPVQEGVEFRHVPDFPGYCVGCDGSIHSCRTTHGKISSTWKKLKGFLGNDKMYASIVLRRDGKLKHLYIHEILLIAFVSLRPSGMECRHLDGNHLNN